MCTVDGPEGTSMSYAHFKDQENFEPSPSTGRHSLVLLVCGAVALSLPLKYVVRENRQRCDLHRLTRLAQALKHRPTQKHEHELSYERVDVCHKETERRARVDTGGPKRRGQRQAVEVHLEQHA